MNTIESTEYSIFFMKGETYGLAETFTAGTLGEAAKRAARDLESLSDGEVYDGSEVGVPIQIGHIPTKEPAMTATLETLASLDVQTPAWATDRRMHLEEVGYRGVTFSRMVEVDANNCPLVILQDISENGDNPGTYIVEEPAVDIDWTGEANACDCRALAASFIEAADVLDSISAGVSA